jgi:hypothetical protein
MKNKLIIGFISTAVVVVLCSCGKVPQNLVDDANKAFKEARAVEADLYLPAEFEALQNSMHSVMAEVEIQNKKLFKNSDAVKVRLEEVRSFANRVVGNTSVIKEAFISSSIWFQDQTRAVLEQNNILITKLKKGKLDATRIEQIKSEMSTITATVKESEKDYDKGNFFDALNKIELAKLKADSLTIEIRKGI